MSGGCERESESPLKKGYRRKRTAFTDTQLVRMERVFQENKYPGISVRETLAANLGVSESRVQVWFQNRRSKFRKMENNVRRANSTVSDNNGDTHSGKETSALHFSWPYTKVCGGTYPRITAYEQNGFPLFPTTAQIPPFHDQVPAIMSDNVAAPTICTSFCGARRYGTASGSPVIFNGGNGFPPVSSVFPVRETTLFAEQKPESPSDSPQDGQQTRDPQEEEANPLKHSVDEVLAAKGLVKVHEM